MCLPRVAARGRHRADRREAELVKREHGGAGENGRFRVWELEACEQPRAHTGADADSPMQDLACLLRILLTGLQFQLVHQFARNGSSSAARRNAGLDLPYVLGVEDFRDRVHDDRRYEAGESPDTNVRCDP